MYMETSTVLRHSPTEQSLFTLDIRWTFIRVRLRAEQADSPTIYCEVVNKESAFDPHTSENIQDKSNNDACEKPCSTEGHCRY